MIDYFDRASNRCRCLEREHRGACIRPRYGQFLLCEFCLDHH